MAHKHKPQKTSESMSDEFTDSPGGEFSDNDTLEVAIKMFPQVFPGLIAPSSDVITLEAQRLQHGDIHIVPGVFGTFNDEEGNMDHEERRKWMRQCMPEKPGSQDEEEDEDHSDIQGWTYIADYSVHSLTPTHSGPFKYYIHARIKHDNRLQFGVFDSVYQGKSKTRIPMASVRKANESVVKSQLLHGDYVPPLRIAGKEEAEAMLLKEGKLILAAAPKLIGCLMNVGNARVTVTYGKTTTYFLKTYYGHIWIYWGAIIDRVFYMVGIPVYNSNDRGTLVYVPGDDGKAIRTYVPLPPTEDDLRSKFGGSVFVGPDRIVSPYRGAFYNASELLWGISSSNLGGFESSAVNVENFLKKYGDSEASIPMCKKALAKISISDTGQPMLSQLYHGDIYANPSLVGHDGGVYAEHGRLYIRNEYDVMSTFIYPEPSGYWANESGVSGYIPVKTRYDRMGHICYAAQAFSVSQLGQNYFIRTVGCLRPYIYYNPDGMLSGIDVALTRAKEPEEENDDEPSYWNPPSDGGGGGGSGGGGGNTDEIIEDVGDVGVWWQAGDGMKITARRDTTATKIRYEFEVSVTDTFTVSQTILYNVKPSFSVADGGSYTVDDGKVTLTMWYYLQGGMQVTVCNLTSKSGSGSTWVDNTHPASATNFSITGTRKAFTRANFAVRYLTNYADPNVVGQNSNIIQLLNTGQTKEVEASIVCYDKNLRKYRKRVKGKMKIYTIALQKANIRNILTNYPRLHAPNASCTCTPQSITGSTSGSCGAPTVKCGSVKATPSKIPTNGETEVRGSFPMHISGYYGEMSVKFPVGNACSGWFEVSPDNRHSVSISGTFTISAPIQRF